MFAPTINGAPNGIYKVNTFPGTDQKANVEFRDAVDGWKPVTRAEMTVAASIAINETLTGVRGCSVCSGPVLTDFFTDYSGSILCLICQ